MRAVRKAEQARNKAARRAAEIKEQARYKLQLTEYSLLPWWRKLFTDVEDMEVDERLVDAVASVWTGDDPQWTVAVSDNKWYLSQAAAYGANR